MTVINKILIQARNDYRADVVSIVDSQIKDLEIDTSQLKPDVDKSIDFLKEWPIEKSLQYIYSSNSINYKLWDKGSIVSHYKNNGKTDSLALQDSFNEFFNYMEINKFNIALIDDNLVERFYGDIPDLNSRVEILKESLNPVLKLSLRALAMKYFKGDDVSFDFLEKIVELMPLSYKDNYFNKAQSATEQAIYIWNKYKDLNLVMTCMSVSADCHLPMVLEAVGVIKYSQSLKEKISNNELLEKDSVEELAIRAATIIACEKIRRFHKLSIRDLNLFLWLNRKEFDTSIHLTNTTEY